MTAVVMPRLSDSMEEGTILKWLKASGDEVRLGEPIAEIETDKATMTYEADAAGFLQIVAAEGETLAIGAVIANMVASARGGGRAAAEPVAAAAPPRAAAEPAAAPAEPAASLAAPRRRRPRKRPRRPIRSSCRPPRRPRPNPPPRRPRPRSPAGASRRRPWRDGSPRSWASISRTVVGSGPDGRVVKADVEAAGNGAATAAPPATAAPRRRSRPPERVPRAPSR